MLSTIWHLIRIYPIPGGIIPHLILPLLLVFSLFCPPFRGRGILFALLIIATDWACVVSPWPPITTAAYQGMRYGLATSWIFVLPVLERILVHTPERDFRRLDATGKPLPAPSELTLGKLRWAVALVATPRGVGWDFGRSGYARPRARDSTLRPRVPFVISSLLRASIAYLATDVALLASKMADIPNTVENAWAALTLWKLAYWDLLMVATVYGNMEMQYHAYAAIDVGICGGMPEDWPPLFGHVTQCYTVGNIWGKFWHDYLRQPALGFSAAIIRTLGLPRRSRAAYFVHLATAFCLSAFVHILSTSVVVPEDADIRGIVRDFSIFFMTQPLLVVVETSVMAAYGRLMTPPKVTTRGEKQVRRGGLRSSSSFQRIAPVASRALGYLWVASTAIPLGWFFTKVYYIGLRAMDWPVPYPVAEASFEWFTQKAPSY